MKEVLDSRLEILSQDSVVIDALKMLFNQRIELERPEVRPDEDNQVIGEKYRSYEEAKKILNGAFLDLEAYNKDNTKSTNFNKSK